MAGPVSCQGRVNNEGAYFPYSASIAARSGESASRLMFQIRITAPLSFRSKRVFLEAMAGSIQ